MQEAGELSRDRRSELIKHLITQHETEDKQQHQQRKNEGDVEQNSTEVEDFDPDNY